LVLLALLSAEHEEVEDDDQQDDRYELKDGGRSVRHRRGRGVRGRRGLSQNLHQVQVGSSILSVALPSSAPVAAPPDALSRGPRRHLGSVWLKCSKEPSSIARRRSLISRW